jgi:hypothetical protein
MAYIFSQIKTHCTVQLQAFFGWPNFGGQSSDASLLVVYLYMLEPWPKDVPSVTWGGVLSFIWESNLEKSRAKVWCDSLALLVSKELGGTEDPKAQAKSLLTKVWKHTRGSKLLSYCFFSSISIFGFQVCHYEKKKSQYFCIMIDQNTKKWNVKKLTF